MALLVWAQEVAAEAGLDAPPKLTAIISEIAPILRALRHADGGLPSFHGGGRGAAGRLDRCLRRPRARPARAWPCHGLCPHGAGAHHADPGRGAPARRTGGGRGPMPRRWRFELTVQRQPLIVNCGPGDGVRPALGQGRARHALPFGAVPAGLSSSA
jgi:uncharacterized heparinase superfamily protein